MSHPVTTIAVFSLAIVSGGIVWNFISKKNEGSRVNRVESSNVPSSIVEPVLAGETEAVKKPAVQTVSEAVLPIPASEFPVSLEKVAGTVVPTKSAQTGKPADWAGALMNLTALNAELSGIEKMAAKTGVLPESGVIEGRFADFNKELDALKGRSLADGQRTKIRKSLRNSSAVLIGRIGKALEARDGNHLVHLAQAELARVMESIQGF